jgi:hypothetical protein
MGRLVALDPQTRSPYTFTNAVGFTDALERFGVVPILPDGTPLPVYSFEGGYLVGGAPLNVWFDQIWYEGQQEILAAHWQSGEIMQPDQALLALPIVEPTAEVLATYAAYKGTPEAQTLTEAYQSAPGPLSSPMLIAGFGVLALLMFSGGRRRSGGPADGNI